MLISSFQRPFELKGMLDDFKAGVVFGGNGEHGSPVFGGAAKFLLQDDFSGRKGDQKKAVRLNAYVVSYVPKVSESAV